MLVKCHAIHSSVHASNPSFNRKQHSCISRLESFRQFALLPSATTLPSGTRAQFALLPSATTLPSGTPCPVRSPRLCYYPTLWYPVPSLLSSPLLLPYPLIPRAQFALLASATTLPSGTPCPVRSPPLCYYPNLWSSRTTPVSLIHTYTYIIQKCVTLI